MGMAPNPSETLMSNICDLYFPMGMTRREPGRPCLYIHEWVGSRSV